MHELLLFGRVSQARHDQLLQIIAGVAGMPPTRLIERHIIFKPKRTPGSKATHIGGTQAVQTQQMQALQGQLKGELFYLQLVGELAEASISGEDRLPDPGDHDSKYATDLRENGKDARSPDFHGSSWSLCFFDQPDPGRRPVTSRMISSVQIIEGNAFDFMDGLGYHYASEYVLEGYRVVHNNVIVLLYRLLRVPETNSNPLKVSGGRSEAGPGSLDAVHHLSSWKPLDPSGSYILQASVRVQDGSKPESMSLGTSELQNFKEMLKGVVDLEVGDRLAMDTRVR